MFKPLTLSIVIPAYNEETYLKTCLSAIAGQTVPADEVIVVDNNSTDNTAAVARLFPFVRLISEKQQGLYHSRQAGMDAATGDIVCRIDADTYVSEDWVAVIRQAFTDMDAQALTGPVGYHDMPFPTFTRWGEDIALRIANKAKYDFLMGANMAIRRSAWELIKHELCNEPYLFEDIDIAIHLLQHNIYPTYLSDMKADVSSRRFEDKPYDFLRYIGGHSRTHDYHGHKTPLGVHWAESAFALVYLWIKPLHMIYDPFLRRPSLSYLLKRRDARPDPMAVQ